MMTNDDDDDDGGDDADKNDDNHNNMNSVLLKCPHNTQKQQLKEQTMNIMTTHITHDK